MIDSSEISGRDTMMAPTRVSLFAISDAIKIIRAETMILVALNIFFLKDCM